MAQPGIRGGTIACSEIGTKIVVPARGLEVLGVDPFDGLGRTRLGIAHLGWRLRHARVLDLPPPVTGPVEPRSLHGPRGPQGELDFVVIRGETRHMVLRRRLVLAVFCALAAGPWLSSDARAAVPFAPCEPAPILCATVTVPTDRSGVTTGTLDLAVRRKPATSGSSGSVLVALTGGPGGAAIPRLASFADRLAAAHTTRDLVVFDVRGVGLSSPISCGLTSPATFDATKRCGEVLGPLRAFFRSRDTADDLEAIRIAVGADRLALYAVSYGAVAAYDYASRYPSRVEWMILDSPVAPEGFDPAMRERVALARVLKSICGTRLCPRPVAPTSDLAAILPRIRSRGLIGRLVNASGRAGNYRIAPSHLYSALVSESDLNAPLRALIPAALRGARTGDPTPLVRLTALTYRDASVIRGAAGAGETQNSTVNRATNCEEAPVPWARDVPPRTTAWAGDPLDPEPRAAAITVAVQGAPTTGYAPFTGLEVVSSRESVARACMAWPHSSRAADMLGTGPAPDIPVLVLSGEHDLRTPLESAVKIAARFPRGQVVTARYTGHAVLGGAPRAVRPCVAAAVERFVAGASGQATCGGASRLPPVPPAPTTLTQVAPHRGLLGTPGRTLAATLKTLEDVKYAWAAAFTLNGGGASVGIGGLRGGKVSGSLRRLVLSRVVYVPGVVVTGTYDPQTATARLTVAGRGSRGTVQLTRTRLTGRLDGRTFSFPKAARPTPLD